MDDPLTNYEQNTKDATGTATIPSPEENWQNEMGVGKLPTEPVKDSLIKSVGERLYVGFEKAAGEFNKLIGLEKIPAWKENVAEPMKKQISEIESRTQKGFVTDFCESLGSLGFKLPETIMVGAASKLLLAGQIIPEAGAILSRIPDFAVGMGIVGGVKATEEGKGAVGIVSTAAEETAIGTAYGAVGNGLKQIPIMASLGAGESIYNALKEGRLPKKEEIIKGGSQGAAYGVVFSILPALKNATQIIGEKSALQGHYDNIQEHIKNGDMPKIKSEVDKMIANESINPELRDAFNNIANKEAETDPETQGVIFYDKKGAEKNPEKMANHVKGFISKTNETVEITKNFESDMNTLRIRAGADDLRARQMLEKVDISPKDAEVLYHYDENNKEVITPEQKEIYEKVIKPIKSDTTRLFEKLRTEGQPITDEEYTPRYIADRGGIFDRMIQGAKNIGKSGLLKKTDPSFKHRTMKALVDEEGNRVVAAIKGDLVTKFENKKGEFLGKLNLKSYEELADKETKPLYDKIKNLEKEERFILDRKSRVEDSAERLKNIQNERDYWGESIADINYKYNPSTLNQKVFTDKSGKRWTIDDATTKEIESNTNLKYHKNVLLNRLITYNNLKKIDRATQFLEGFKESKDFGKFGMKYGTANIPEGWKQTDLPQFRGYAFEPRIADALNHFAKKMYSGEKSFKVLSNVNHFLRTTIFFNPLIHTPNIANHWAVNRGLMKWTMPKEYATLWKTGGRAIDAVIHQNQDYLDMLDSGANLIFHKQGNTLQELMVDKMGEEAAKNKTLLKRISEDFGYVNPINWAKAVYKFSGQVTWATNDIATMQAVYEEMDGGRSMQEAIENVGKHIPNYIIPSRVLNSVAVSKLMSSEATMFGAYHYGALHSYGEMAKTLFGDVPLKERAEVLDKLAMLGIMSLIVYPNLDKLAKLLSGNKNAHIGRAGASTFPDNIAKLLKGQIVYPQLIQSVVTPSVGVTAGVQFASNRNLFTGKQLIHTDSALQDLVTSAEQSIAPLSAMQRLQEGKISFKDWTLSLARISTSDPNKGKWFSMMDSKADMQQRLNKLYKDNPEAAVKKMDAFNESQIKKLSQIMKENGIEGKVQKAELSKVIISSIKERSANMKTLEDMLTKKQGKSKTFVKRSLNQATQDLLKENAD